jgi:D-alanine-D-alanine ligase
VRIAVLHDEPPADPRPDEQDTQQQARSVAGELEASGHEVTRVAFGLDLAAVRRALVELAPDLVVNLVESAGGSGRLIHLAPALLELLGLRFTGASSAAMFTTTHKLLAKRLLVAAGLPTPAWVDRMGEIAVGKSTRDRVDGTGGIAVGNSTRAGRWILKSVFEDASIGIGDDAVVELSAPLRLPALLAERASGLGGEAFAERYVDGREFNLSLLAKDGDVEVLPAAEIVFEGFPPGKPRIVGYAAKWDEASFEFSHTPRRSAFEPSDRALLAELEALARRVWSLFGLSGYARVDFRVDGDGRPWILEANANPCLSEDAGFAAAAARANLGRRALLARILAAAR